jgi:hypothetical protein
VTTARSVRLPPHDERGIPRLGVCLSGSLMSEGGVHWLLVLSPWHRSHEFITVRAAERLVHPYPPDVLEDSGPPPNAARRSVAQRGEFGLREGGLRLLHGGGHQGGVEEFGTKLERSVQESVQGPTDSVTDEEERRRNGPGKAYSV